MTAVAELFAKLTCDLEDLHAIAVEGQVPDQPIELQLIFVDQICNGLYRCEEIVAEIKFMLGAA